MTERVESPCLLLKAKLPGGGEARSGDRRLASPWRVAADAYCLNPTYGLPVKREGRAVSSWL